MTHKIKSVQAKENLIIAATFLNGSVKEYNVKQMFEICSEFSMLENDNLLFNKVQVDPGGYGISWNDDLDLDSETIWEEGIDISTYEQDIFMQLATLLMNTREQCNFTQKKLAEITSITQADISKIERGIANPSLNTLKRLAKGMGMTLKLEFVPEISK